MDCWCKRGFVLVPTHLDFSESVTPFAKYNLYSFILWRWSNKTIFHYITLSPLTLLLDTIYQSLQEFTIYVFMWLLRPKMLGLNCIFLCYFANWFGVNCKNRISAFSNFESKVSFPNLGWFWNLASFSKGLFGLCSIAKSWRDRII